MFDYVAWVDADANFDSDIGSHTTISDRDYFQAIMQQGKGQLFITEKIEFTPWSLFIVLNSSEIFKTATNVQTKSFLCGAIIIVLVLLIVGIFLIKALASLNIVVSTITDIASGEADLTKRINLNSNNEIGRVVADEIRKLSEDSGAQSQTIENQLSKITMSIEQIVEASGCKFCNERRHG